MKNEQHATDQVVAALLPRDKCAAAHGIELVTVRPGYAEARMRVREDMLNPYGTCHGGMILTLADTAFAYSSLSRNQQTVAQDLSINFVRPGQAGDTLTAIAEERTLGGRTGVYDITVTDSAGKTVALLRGKSFRIGGEIVTTEENEHD